MAEDVDPTRGALVGDSASDPTASRTIGEDPTRGLEVGDQASEDPTGAPGAAAGDDPTQGDEIGATRGEDPTQRARPRGRYSLTRPTPAG